MREFAGSPPVETVAAERLRNADETVATAESCTGGLAGALLSAPPGASDYYDRTVVSYSYDAKLDTGVARETLDDHGAVSAPVAREMARAVRDTAGTDWGVATTGVAGPTGGDEETPVGTAYVAVAYAGPWGTGTSFTAHRRHRFEGGRSAVRERIARATVATLLDATRNP